MLSISVIYVYGTRCANNKYSLCKCGMGQRGQRLVTPIIVMTVWRVGT